MDTLLTDMKEKAKEVSSLLKGLANPERLMILCILSQEKLTVGDIEKKLNLSQSALSQHLAKLRHANFVSTERSGKFIHYEISDKKIMELFKILHKLYCCDDKPAK